jgi:hypothetical protein
MRRIVFHGGHSLSASHVGIYRQRERWLQVHKANQNLAACLSLNATTGIHDETSTL